MVDVGQIRAFAVALPEVVEQPHFGRPAFRVRDKLFVSVHADETPPSIIAHVSPELAAAEAEVSPESCEEVWRTHGGRDIFVGLRVDLSATAADRVGELVGQAWRHRAPKRLVTEHDG